MAKVNYGLTTPDGLRWDYRLFWVGYALGCLNVVLVVIGLMMLKVL